MKVLTSTKINAFGGLNFIHHELEKINLGDFLYSELPLLSKQSLYSWKDIFYSLLSIYYCGGDCIEDTKTVLSNHFDNSPFFNLCSPDTLSRRMKSLANPNEYCQTIRGKVRHEYNCNDFLAETNIRLLKKLGVFDSDILVLDYDNTIIFNEKQDSKMTYKKDYGYQPGVCFVNEHNVMYLENRNGNSDAKSFQLDTLTRMFQHLKNNGITHVDKFRADSASYQYDVIKLLDQAVSHFYIAVKTSYVEKYFSQIDNWKTATDTLGEQIEVGSIKYVPFVKRYKKGDVQVEYNLLVKRKLKKQGQTNLFTEDAHEYRAIITNHLDCDVEQGLQFYYQRGRAEREFDVLKNDFGWSSLPFSKLADNTVFLYLTAFCRNLYNVIIGSLSFSYKGISPKIRMKRLIFTFTTLPAKWIKQSRAWKLRIYGYLPLRI